MELPEQLNFLTSTRFWSMVIAAVSLYGKQKGWLGDSEMLLIATISGGFWVTSTVDRAADKLGKTETEAKEEVKES